MENTKIQTLSWTIITDGRLHVSPPRRDFLRTAQTSLDDNRFSATSNFSKWGRHGRGAKHFRGVSVELYTIIISHSFLQMTRAVSSGASFPYGKNGRNR